MEIARITSESHKFLKGLVGKLLWCLRTLPRPYNTGNFLTFANTPGSAYAAVGQCIRTELKYLWDIRWRPLGEGTYGYLNLGGSFQFYALLLLV